MCGSPRRGVGAGPHGDRRGMIARAGTMICDWSELRQPPEHGGAYYTASWQCSVGIGPERQAHVAVQRWGTCSAVLGMCSAALGRSEGRRKGCTTSMEVLVQCSVWNGCPAQSPPHWGGSAVLGTAAWWRRVWPPRSGAQCSRLHHASEPVDARDPLQPAGSPPPLIDEPGKLGIAAVHRGYNREQCEAAATALNGCTQLRPHHGAGHRARRGVGGDSHNVAVPPLRRPLLHSLGCGRGRGLRAAAAATWFHFADAGDSPDATAQVAAAPLAAAQLPLPAVPQHAPLPVRGPPSRVVADALVAVTLRMTQHAGNRTAVQPSAVPPCCRGRGALRRLVGEAGHRLRAGEHPRLLLLPLLLLAGRLRGERRGVARLVDLPVELGGDPPDLREAADAPQRHLVQGEIRGNLPLLGSAPVSLTSSLVHHQPRAGLHDEVRRPGGAELAAPQRRQAPLPLIMMLLLRPRRGHGRHRAAEAPDRSPRQESCTAPAQRSAAQRSAAQRSAAQRSAAQRSAAQRSAAQRSAAQRNAPQRSAALHCAALHCAAVHSSAAVHCAALRCAAVHCAALRCIALRCAALGCSALRSIALLCSALRCAALGCAA
eukprot:gene1190-biopygen9031